MAAFVQIAIDLTALDQLRADTEALQTPDEEVMARGTRRTAMYVRDVWYGAVQGNMLPGMSRPVKDDEYAQSLQTGEAIQLPGPWEALVISTYAGVSRIENGYPPFDIKPGLLASPNAREGKNGPYMNVPFRHFTPDEEAPFGDRVHGQTMPPEVYREAKEMEPYQPGGGGGRIAGGELETWGQRGKLLEHYLTPAQQAGLRKEKGLLAGQTLSYEWQTGLYAGMVRVAMTYEQKTQSQYMTWRRVSRKSDPASWWHPGQSPNPVIRAVAQEAQHEVARMQAEAWCEAVGRPDLMGKIEVAGQ